MKFVMLPQILPRQRTSKQARKYDRLGERTRHQSKLVLHATLLRGLIAQDYAPFVVRVALATRSHVTTNVKTTLQIQINQQIDNQKYRWCVARPASPYQLIITRDAATLCIAVSEIVPPIQTKIANKITNNPTAREAPHVPAPPIGPLITTNVPMFHSMLKPSVKRQLPHHRSSLSRPTT